MPLEVNKRTGACADHWQWLGNFLGGIFSYANAFVDCIHVQTSKGTQLIMGIWRTDHMLPTFKWGRTENQPWSGISCNHF